MRLLTIRNSVITALITTGLTLNGCVVQHRTVVQSPSHHHDRYYDHRFSADDNYYLYHYYHPRYKYKERRYKRTPPGHYKRPYMLHQPLPNHIRYQRLPRDMERRLPRIPDDLIRIRIGGDILLIHRKTRVIYDILFDF